jgi:hypothetical protein
MLTNEDLDKAVTEGVISPQQAVRLRDLAAEAADISAPVDPDEERFRILGGFNDIFVTIGLFLLIGAIYTFSASYGSPIYFSLLSVAIAWGLSEVFSRNLKLALPSIILSLMFTSSVLASFVFYMDLQDWFSSFTEVRTGSKYFTLICLGTAAATALHMWRFRVPIDGAQIAALLVAAAFGVVTMIFGEEKMTTYYLVIFFLSGLAVFSVAMRLDMSDRLRVTRRSDAAFWLHLLAAPLLIHPIAQSFADITNITTLQAVIILLAFGLLSLFALIIDRRAILVSALAYTGTALGYLIQKTTSPDSTLPITLLVLALVVLSLSAGWHRLRAHVVNGLPLGDDMRNTIPPIL